MKKTTKLPKSFYQQSTLDIVKQFLGKYLVYNSPKGKISGKIIDVEAYPAFTDDVSHSNKRTKRTEVCYQEGGYVYIYLIYGIHHQFAVVVNKKDTPDVVFIRGVIPDEGIETMRENFGRPAKQDEDLTKTPGNFCKSFGIDMNLYGDDLTGDTIWLEDRGEQINENQIKTDTRVGIQESIEGSKNKFRFYIT